MEKTTLGPDVYTLEPCASSNAFEIRLKERRIDIDKVDIGETIAKTPVVLVAKFEGYALSVYASGRIMIKGIKQKDAVELSEKIIHLLEKSGAIT